MVAKQPVNGEHPHDDEASDDAHCEQTPLIADIDVNSVVDSRIHGRWQGNIDMKASSLEMPKIFEHNI